MYSKPDVFVTVEVPEASQTVEVPRLLPAMVGEHYFIARDVFVSDVTGAELVASYPGLPKSSNVPADSLAVDVADGFEPTAYILTESGGQADVTDQVVFTGSQFTLAAGAPAGALFVNYRALSDKYAGTEAKLLKATSVNDLTALFGSSGLGPSNPLGYAMFNAMTFGSVHVAGLAVTTAPDGATGQYAGQILDIPLAYAYALDFLKKQDVYAIVPLTNNAAVMDLTVAHVESMSSESGRSERRALFVPDMTGDLVVRGGTEFDFWRTLEDDVTTFLSVTKADLGLGEVFDLGGFPVIKVGQSEFYIQGPSSDFSVGDDSFRVQPSPVLIGLPTSAIRPSATRVKTSDDFIFYFEGERYVNPIISLGVAGDETLIKVDNSEEIIQDSGPYQFTRTVDPITERDALIAAYKQLPRAYGTERLIICAPGWLFDPQLGVAGQDVPAYFGAAKIAGELCRVGIAPAGAAPGLAGIGFLESKEHLFRSSRYFTEEELTEIGGSGWTLFVNDFAGIPVNTQHTLTTNASTLEYREAILGVERDFLARTFRTELRKMLRKFRLEDQTINVIAMKCGAIAKTLTFSGSISRCFKSVSVLSVVQNPNEPDQVLIEVEATHLYPLNRGKVRVQIVA